MSEKQNNVIHFQPPGIKKEYCEAGIILESDPDYIHYIDEPAKILKSEVKIIPNENVICNRTHGLCKVKN